MYVSKRTAMVSSAAVATAVIIGGLVILGSAPDRSAPPAQTSTVASTSPPSAKAPHPSPSSTGQPVVDGGETDPAAKPTRPAWLDGTFPSSADASVFAAGVATTMQSISYPDIPRATWTAKVESQIVDLPGYSDGTVVTKAQLITELRTRYPTPEQWAHYAASEVREELVVGRTVPTSPRELEDIYTGAGFRPEDAQRATRAGGQWIVVEGARTATGGAGSLGSQPVSLGVLVICPPSGGACRLGDIGDGGNRS